MVSYECSARRSNKRTDCIKKDVPSNRLNSIFVFSKFYMSKGLLHEGRIVCKYASHPGLILRFTQNYMIYATLGSLLYYMVSIY